MHANFSPFRTLHMPPHATQGSTRLKPWLGTRGDLEDAAQEEYRRADIGRATPETIHRALEQIRRFELFYRDQS